MRHGGVELRIRRRGRTVGVLLAPLAAQKLPRSLALQHQGDVAARLPAPSCWRWRLNMSAPSSEHDPCVLIVDAAERNRATLAQTLASEGYLVLTAASGRDALGILSKPLSAVDVIVLDPRLPHMAAVDFCSRLRKNHPRIPMIVCASEPNPREDARLLELGVRRYLLKPITPDELLAAVEAVLPR